MDTAGAITSECLATFDRWTLATLTKTLSRSHLRLSCWATHLVWCHFQWDFLYKVQKRPKLTLASFFSFYFCCFRHRFAAIDRHSRTFDRVLRPVGAVKLYVRTWVRSIVRHQMVSWRRRVLSIPADHLSARTLLSNQRTLCRRTYAFELTGFIFTCLITCKRCLISRLDGTFEQRARSLDPCRFAKRRSVPMRSQRRIAQLSNSPQTKADAGFLWVISR